MKNKITEHSKKLRIKTTDEWQKQKLKDGGYTFKVLLTDKEMGNFARNEIKNKAEFLKNAIKEFMNKEQNNKCTQ
jgi:uncharacterized membrane protein YheB (UPF0754 family)